MSDAHLVGGDPPQGEGGCLGGKAGQGREGAKPTPGFAAAHHPHEVEGKGGEIDKGGGAEDLGVDHYPASPSAPMAAVSQLSSRFIPASFLLLRPVTLIRVPSPAVSRRIQNCRWDRK